MRIHIALFASVCVANAMAGFEAAREAKQRSRSVLCGSDSNSKRGNQFRTRTTRNSTCLIVGAAELADQGFWIYASLSVLWLHLRSRYQATATWSLNSRKAEV